MVRIGSFVGRYVAMSNAVPIINAVPYYPYNEPPIIPEDNVKNKQEKELLKHIISIEKGITDSKLEGKEKDVIIKARVNQSEFRQQLLERYQKCCLCSITDKALLIASHIKPWCESEASEKLDVENGFLLCPNHDKLFDSGLISFADNGKTMISKHLKYDDISALNINENILIPLTEANKKYLTYHREHIFKKD